LLDLPHDLVSSERRAEFDAAFRDFNEKFVDYYATNHDQCVGPMGKFEELVEFEGSRDVRNLQLLSGLPLGDSSYMESLDAWLTEFRDYQCTFPVRDLLRERPSCQCNFKLSRPLDITQLVEDLKSFLHLGISHHKQILAHYNAAIESRLIQEDGTPARNADVMRTLLSDDPLPDLSQEVIDQLNSCIDGHLHQEQLCSPLPAIVSAGSFTKRELQLRIQNWLDNLSDKEGVVFTLKDF
jgi:hypothetical protein